MKRISLVFFLIFSLALVAGTAYAREGTVKGSYVNLRADDNFNANIIGKKMRGEKYEVTHESKGWLKVKFADGSEGWIFETLTEKQGKEGDLKKKPEKDEPAISTSTTVLPPLPDAIASPTLSAKDAKKAEKAREKADKEKEKDRKAAEKAAKDEAKAREKEAKKKDKPEDVADTASPSKVLSSSKSPEEYYNLAIDLFEKKRYPEALEANKMALLQAPQNAEILNNYANCLFKMGKVEEALKSWKESLAIAPKSAKICNNMGIAYYQSDDNEKAIEYYKKAILFEPDFPDPYYNVASVYGFKGQFQSALENYKKYLTFSIDPTMKQLSEERIEYCEKQLAANPKKGSSKDKDGKEGKEAKEPKDAKSPKDSKDAKEGKK